MTFIYIIAFLSVSCLIVDVLIMLKPVNQWYLEYCCERAERFGKKEKVNAWIERYIQEDKANEVVWRDICNAIKKDTGIKLDAGLLRGFMYINGYKTVSDYMIDTYVFTVSYKGIERN